MSRVFVIAEAGVNHNGDIGMAKRLIDVAKASGADAVKFQSFITEQIVTKKSEVAEYQKASVPGKKSQWELLKELELSFAQQKELKRYCDDAGIEFMSTPFDLLSLKFLAEDIEVKRIKMPSGEITNAQLLFAAGQTRLPLILSTGMSTWLDVENGLDVISYGRAKSQAPASFREMQGFHRSEDGQKNSGNISILHCVSQYPAPVQDLNLNVLKELNVRFPAFTIGYSDHSTGILAPVVAVALGAKVIEKHFTLDKLLPGPDHRASLDPAELSEMMKAIRDVEQMLGTTEKGPAPSERDSIIKIRRSVVAIADIAAGEVFTDRNIGVRRVIGRISPLYFFDLLGRISSKPFVEGEPIQYEAE